MSDYVVHYLAVPVFGSVDQRKYHQTGCTVEDAIRRFRQSSKGWLNLKEVVVLSCVPRRFRSKSGSGGFKSK
jgi:hypothetical protein